MKLTLCAIGASAVLASAGPVAAQNLTDFRVSSAPGGFLRDRNVGVLERAPAEYEALGLRLGSFRLDPSLGFSTSYTDNALFQEQNTRSDGIFEIRPSISASSQWSRHALGAFFSADVARYADNGTEDTNNWSAGISGRLDGSRNTTLTGNLSYSELREPRSSSSSPDNVLNPIFYTLGQANATLSQTFNRLRFVGTAALRDYDYSDAKSPAGLVVDEDYRDDFQASFTGRGEYALTPDRALFLELGYTQFDYDPTTSAGYDRGSQITTALAGASLDLTDLIRGEVGVGYLYATHDDATRRDVSGFSARARVEYFPTRLTTVTANASRDFRDTGIRESTGSQTSILSLRVDHELLRNVVLSGTAAYQLNEYEDIDRQDQHVSLGFSARYLLNRRVSLNAEYAHESRDSSGRNAGRDFSSNIITAGVTLRY